MEKRYQIFISSTFADLQNERKGIMEAIIELNCFPAGMEMFPATDTEQFEYIKSVIDESDYYIAIIAGRYGSLAEDGISYTEKEFNYAISKGIPVLAFLKKDINSLPYSKTENDPEGKKKLEIFRNRVLQGRLARYWDNADNLKYIIHSSLSKEFKIHPRIGWVKGNEKILQLETGIKLQNDNIHVSDIDNIILEIKKSINLSVEFPENSLSDISVSLEDFLKFIGTNLISPCSENLFIRMTNDFIQYQCSSNIIGSQLAAITPASLSLLKTKLFAYEIIDIKNSNAIEYYTYTKLGTELIKIIGKLL